MHIFRSLRNNICKLRLKKKRYSIHYEPVKIIDNTKISPEDILLDFDKTHNETSSHQCYFPTVIITSTTVGTTWQSYRLVNWYTLLELSSGKVTVLGNFSMYNRAARYFHEQSLYMVIKNDKWSHKVTEMYPTVFLHNFFSVGRTRLKSQYPCLYQGQCLLYLFILCAIFT